MSILERAEKGKPVAWLIIPTKTITAAYSTVEEPNKDMLERCVAIPIGAMSQEDLKRMTHELGKLKARFEKHRLGKDNL